MSAAQEAARRFTDERPAPVPDRPGELLGPGETCSLPPTTDRLAFAAPRPRRRFSARTAPPRSVTRSVVLARRDPRDPAQGRRRRNPLRRRASCAQRRRHTVGHPARDRGPRGAGRPACRSTRSRSAPRTGVLPDGQRVPPDPRASRRSPRSPRPTAYESTRRGGGERRHRERLGSSSGPAACAPRSPRGRPASARPLLILAGWRPGASGRGSRELADLAVAPAGCWALLIRCRWPGRPLAWACQAAGRRRLRRTRP